MHVNGIGWVFAAAIVLVASGLPACCFSRHSTTAQWLDPTGATAVPPLELFAPSQWISGMAVALVAVAGLGIVLLRRRFRRPDAESVGTWGCGYAHPTPRMQYTASSFGENIVGLFGWALRPRVRNPKILTPFPARSEFECEVPDTVLDRFVLPVFRRAARYMMKLRLLQQGRLEIYLLYMVAILIFLLIWGQSSL